MTALDFHHLDPSKKDPKYTNLRVRFDDKLKNELDKCVLLCANCHREEHYLLFLITKERLKQDDNQVIE